MEWTSLYGIDRTTQDVKCLEPVTRFSNGYAVVRFAGFQYPGTDNIGYTPVTTKEELGLTDYMLIDLQGNLTPFDKDFFYSDGANYWDQWDNYMKRGFLLSRRSGRYGVLDQNGAVAIPYLYGEMQRDPFLDGVAMVQRDAGEPASIIDLKGNTVIPEGEWQSLSAFVDGADTSVWAQDAVAWAVGAGVLNGKDGSRLDPQGTATRAEVAQVLMNFGQHVMS